MPIPLLMGVTQLLPSVLRVHVGRRSLGFCLIWDFFFPACNIYKCHSVPRMCCTGGVSLCKVLGPAPTCLPRLLQPILTHLAGKKGFQPS